MMQSILEYYDQFPTCILVVMESIILMSLATISKKVQNTDTKKDLGNIT